MNNQNETEMNMNIRKRRPTDSSGNRAGAAAVEFALCVPLLFLVTWGCIEMTRYNLVKNVAHQAAFEAARVGVKPGATVQEIEDEAQRQMQNVCSECTVDVTPGVITSNTETITVNVQVDIRSQGLLLLRYFDDPILEASFTIRRDSVATY